MFKTNIRIINVDDVEIEHTLKVILKENHVLISLTDLENDIMYVCHYTKHFNHLIRYNADKFYEIIYEKIFNCDLINKFNFCGENRCLTMDIENITMTFILRPYS
jgi:hypothetical protein